MSIAVTAQWITNCLVSWSFPMMDKNTYRVEQFNHGFSYWLYGGMSLMAALFVWKMVPETKGKSLEDMAALISQSPQTTSQSTSSHSTA